MDIEFDLGKNRRNIELRGISFELATKFDWDSAIVWDDTRKDYGERRFCALGYIGDRIHQIVFTLRGEKLRVISLRKANKREIKYYAAT